MLVVIIVLLLVSSFIGGVFLFMNNRGGEEVGNTGEIIVTSSDTKSSSAQETDKQDNESSTKKTSIKTLEIGYPKARYVRVGKNALIEKWEERPIVLNEVYVYGKDSKNIALKKPIATNSSGKETLSAFNDGDEMTLGNTVSGDKNNNQLQRQNIEIDLGSMQEIQSVVLLMKGIDKGLLVTLFDDKLNVVSMTRELTIEDTNKGSKHKFDFGTIKWSVLPVDCVGKWSEWSQCSAGCSEDGKQPDGSQKRDWITLRKAENGGKACVYDVNKDGFKVCKGSTGSWTGWSGCSRRCGTGSSTRKFIVKTKGDGDGSTCPGGANGKTESKNCNTHGCPPRFTHPGYNLCGGWWDVFGNCDNECWNNPRCKAYMQANHEHGYRCRLYDNSHHCGNRPWDWSGAKVRNPNYYAP
jgi:hypothetical protein